MKVVRSIALLLLLIVPTLGLAFTANSFWSGTTTSPVAGLFNSHYGLGKLTHATVATSQSLLSTNEKAKVTRSTGGINSVPEPGTVALFGAGLIGLFGMRHRILN